MKTLYKNLFIFGFLIFNININLPKEKRFVVYFYVRNDSKTIIKSLSSVVNQSYPYFRILCTNDASDDNTLHLIKNFIQEKKLQHKITIINNKNYLGKIHSICNLLTTCKDNEILVLVDNDFYFSRKTILNILANIYESLDVWLTFGTCSIHPKEFNIIRPGLSLNILEKNMSFKKCCFFPPPYSFYVKLLRQVNLNKLFHDNIDKNIRQKAAEYFLLWKLLEISTGHIGYIQDILGELKIEPIAWLYKDYCIRYACNSQM